ncbi:hypothetical protein [Gordonia sihwensis]|uniref:hypothetical protein n=1 Tax=Gordonia sihwensis TaxID=173559 RepID=UPI003D9901BD
MNDYTDGLILHELGHRGDRLLLYPLPVIGGAGAVIMAIIFGTGLVQVLRGVSESMPTGVQDEQLATVGAASQVGGGVEGVAGGVVLGAELLPDVDAVLACPVSEPVVADPAWLVVEEYADDGAVVAVGVAAGDQAAVTIDVEGDTRAPIGALGS